MYVCFIKVIGVGADNFELFHKKHKASETPTFGAFLFYSQMAYFSNGSEGMVFEDQCARCKFGQYPCPIALVQIQYNYDQYKDKSGTATKILDHLVKSDGTCEVFEMAKSDFAVDPNQISLF